MRSGYASTHLLHLLNLRLPPLNQTEISVSGPARADDEKKWVSDCSEILNNIVNYFKIT